MAFLVDSSAVIDLLGPEPRFRLWSAETIKRSRELGPVYLNQIVVAECLAGNPAVPPALLHGFKEESLPWAAGPLAGNAYRDYKLRGGAKNTILPDFLIGAHAAVARLGLITRDPRRVRTAFPGVRLITPETDPL